MIQKILLAIFFITALASCSSKNTNTKNAQAVHLTEKQLIEFNKKLLNQEDHEIDNFIKQQGWKMKQTNTGLRYMILKHGKGPKAKEGKIATIAYSVGLLNGSVVYSSAKTGNLSFEIGHGGVVSGLEEGIILLKVGDKAKFILPSHLAYGLSGDGKKIPPHAALIYTVELINLN